MSTAGASLAEGADGLGGAAAAGVCSLLCASRGDSPVRGDELCSRSGAAARRGEAVWLAPLGGRVGVAFWDVAFWAVFVRTVVFWSDAVVGVVALLARTLLGVEIVS